MVLPGRHHRPAAGGSGEPLYPQYTGESIDGLTVGAFDYIGVIRLVQKLFAAGAVMTAVVLVKMVVYVDFKMTLLALIPMILISIGCYFYGIEARKHQTRRQDAFSELPAGAVRQVVDSLTGREGTGRAEGREPGFRTWEKGDRHGGTERCGGTDTIGRY